jgi:hypothetical protein
VRRQRQRELLHHLPRGRGKAQLHARRLQEGRQARGLHQHLHLLLGRELRRRLAHGHLQRRAGRRQRQRHARERRGRLLVAQEERELAGAAAEARVQAHLQRGVLVQDALRQHTRRGA